MDFRFNNPGARANAMGGAFIGVADDATGDSLVSAVFTRDKATIAIYRQQFLNTDTSFTYGGAENKVDLSGDILGVGMGFKAGDMVLGEKCRWTRRR